MTIKSPISLKNQDNILPIDLSKINRIAVVGTLVKQLKIDNKSLWSVLKKAVNTEAELIFAAGHLDTNEVNETVMNEAQRAASIADLVVIFVGYLDEKKRLEAVKLPMPQNVLVDVVSQVEGNLVVVVLGNEDLKMPWEKGVKGILRVDEVSEGLVDFIFENS